MIRALLVDDEALVRAGLRMILESAADIEVVGEAADGTQVPAAVAAHAPDIVLMDIRMPRLDGLAATASIRALPDAPAVLVLTTFDLDEYVFRALQAGAAGFLLKDSPPAELIRAVRVVAAGEAMLAPTVTRRLIDRFADTDRDQRRRVARSRLDRLTVREREVAATLATGGSNAEIARALFLSEATVKAHVSALLTKLTLANRVQVAILVHEAELPG